jgi:hypothetical protein
VTPPAPTVLRVDEASDVIVELIPPSQEPNILPAPSERAGEAP